VVSSGEFDFSTIQFGLGLLPCALPIACLLMLQQQRIPASCSCARFLDAIYDGCHDDDAWRLPLPTRAARYPSRFSYLYVYTVLVERFTDYHASRFLFGLRTWPRWASFPFSDTATSLQLCNFLLVQLNLFFFLILYFSILACTVNTLGRDTSASVGFR